MRSAPAQDASDSDSDLPLAVRRAQAPLLRVNTASTGDVREVNGRGWEETMGDDSEDFLYEDSQREVTQQPPAAAAQEGGAGGSAAAPLAAAAPLYDASFGRTAREEAVWEEDEQAWDDPTLYLGDGKDLGP